MNLSLGQLGISSVNLRISAAQLQLLHQAMAEAALGIRLINFSTQVGIPKIRAKELIELVGITLKEQPHDSELMPLGLIDLSLSTNDCRAFRNALELVMRDLGQIDFQTRTGFYLSEAAQMLDELNAALIAPLHIESRQRALGQELQEVREPHVVNG